MNIQRFLYIVPLRLKSIFRASQVERELDAELRFHLDSKIEEGIASGLTPHDARLAALRAMDGLDQRKEEMRDARRIHWLTDFVDDARYALRSLRRTFGLTAFVVITLALGIGMSAAAFSMVDGLILRPYPVSQPGRIVDLVSTTRDNGFDNFSYREYLDIRRMGSNYTGVVATPTSFPSVSARNRRQLRASRPACSSAGITSACSESTRKSDADFARKTTLCPDARP